jgi:hypothetical protein
MAETFDEYKARILRLVEGKDPVAVQSMTVGELQRLVEGVPSAKLTARPTPDKWSVAEVLAHLSEAEISAFWRYRQIIEHDGCALAPYGQDLWAALGKYGTRDPRQSLEMFRLLRETNLRMFDGLTDEQWKRKGVHAERGPMTVRDLALQLAGHDVNHLAQIKAILDA